MRIIFYKLLSFFSPLGRLFFANRFRVLAYHDIKDIDKFELQIKYLTSKFSVVSVEDVRRNCEEGIDLPKFPLLITFDDGDISLKGGLKILETYNCPAVVFVITGLIDTKDNFWWDTVALNALQQDKNISEIQSTISLLKNIRNSERLAVLKSYRPTFKEQLTAEDLLFLEKQNITIGNHSFSHPMFNKCDEREIKEELHQTRIFFEKYNLRGYDIFAYPNGSYDLKSEKLLRENGINFAFLFDHKVNPKKLNPMRLSRIRANSDMPLAELKSKVSGFHPLLYNLIKRVQ